MQHPPECLPRHPPARRRQPLPFPRPSLARATAPVSPAMRRRQAGAGWHRRHRAYARTGGRAPGCRWHRGPGPAADAVAQDRHAFPGQGPAAPLGCCCPGPARSRPSTRGRHGPWEAAGCALPSTQSCRGAWVFFSGGGGVLQRRSWGGAGLVGKAPSSLRRPGRAASRFPHLSCAREASSASSPTKDLRPGPGSCQ